MSMDARLDREETERTAGISSAAGRPLLLRKGFVLALLLGVVDFWITRTIIVSDGISYLEIARRYADGRWSAAINAYWSPFYSWLLAGLRLITGRSDRYEVLGLHLLNLAAYVVALMLFERLLTLLGPREGGEEGRARYVCFRICGYCVFLWASLHMIGVGYCSPDMLVLALTEAAAILLIAMRRDRGGWVPYPVLGAVLAIAYLTKAAMFPIGLVTLGVAGWMVRGQPRWRMRMALLVGSFALLCAPWLAALHRHEGMWTIGEAGRLNYAWEVDGAARTIDWQGGPGEMGTPAHPARKIFSHPDAYEFGSPLDATYPLWFDPSYWYAGIRPGLHPAAQMRVLAINLRYVAVLLLILPGCAAAGLAAAISKQRRAWLASLRELGYLLVPATATILLYCLVYVDGRYIAGPLVVVGLCALASAVPRLTNPMQLDLAKITAAGVLVIFVPVAMLMYWLRTPRAVMETSQEAVLAREVRGLGLRRGDRAAYVGFSINAYWALLDGIRVTAEVPPVYRRRGSLDHALAIDYRNLDEFWEADAATKERLYARLRSLGVRAVMSNYAPAGADRAGWVKLTGLESDGQGYEPLFVRLLEQP